MTSQVVLDRESSFGDEDVPSRPQHLATTPDQTRRDQGQPEGYEHPDRRAAHS